MAVLHYIGALAVNFNLVNGSSHRLSPMGRCYDRWDIHLLSPQVDHTGDDVYVCGMKQPPVNTSGSEILQDQGHCFFGRVHLY